MGRAYGLRCQDCHEKIDWSKSMEEIEAQKIDDYFHLEVAFDNCTEVDVESMEVEVNKLMAWLEKHKGHKIYFGW